MTATPMTAVDRRNDFFAPFRRAYIPGHDEWCRREDVVVGYCGTVSCGCGWGAEVDLGEPGSMGELRLSLRRHLIDAERTLLEEGETHFMDLHYPPTPTPGDAA